MRRFVFAGGLIVLGVLGTLGATGCGVSEEDDVLSARVSALNAGTAGDPLPLCRWLQDQLRGNEASVFPVKNNDYFVGVSMRGAPMCVDTVVAVYRSGVLASTEGDDPACVYCDGTPLPAAKLLELVNKYDDAGSPEITP